MKKKYKILYTVLSITIFSIILSLYYYYTVFFKTHLVDINNCISTSNNIYKDPPSELFDIAIIAEGYRGIRHFVVKTLLYKYEMCNQGMLKWHLHNFCWDLLIKIHFSSNEVFLLWCYFVPYSEGVGLNNAANYFFDRDLNQLELKEIVTIIAMVKSPSIYKMNTEKLHKRVDYLLGEYNKITTK